MVEAAIKALQAQHRELMQDPPPGINAGPADDDWLDWTAVVQVHRCTC
jgi:ubiquitin-protein ligase